MKRRHPNLLALVHELARRRTIMNVRAPHRDALNFAAEEFFRNERRSIDLISRVALRYYMNWHRTILEAVSMGLGSGYAAVIENNLGFDKLPSMQVILEDELSRGTGRYQIN